MRRERRNFSEQFKREAVLRVTEGGLSRTEVGAELDVQASLIGTWVKQYQESGGKEGLSPSEREELKALRKENRKLQMERDILKKATAFFAKESK